MSVIGENTKFQYFIIKLLYSTICSNAGQVVSDKPTEPYKLGVLNILQKSTLPQNYSS